MKLFILAFISTLMCNSVSAQILNSGFETKEPDSEFSSSWRFTGNKTFSVSLDSSQKRTGRYSLKVSESDSLVKDHQGFSQQINLPSNKIRRVELSVYIHTDGVKGDVAIWCQLWNTKLDKMVGFQDTPGSSINRTGDWTKHTLNLLLERGVDQLVFGGYLKGSGSAYFDDFSLDEHTYSINPPTDSVKRYLHSFINIVKRNSLYRDSIDWDQVGQDVSDLSIGMEKVEDVHFISKYVLGKLKGAGDNHSFIQQKKLVKAYAAGNTSKSKTASGLLAGNIGYLSIPAFGSIDQKTMDDFANDIQKRIQDLDSAHEVKGWIVDLRRNGGGNMHPMIAGLGPVTGEGILGYFVYEASGTKRYFPWSYKAKKNSRKHTLGVRIANPYRLRNIDGPVAVLIGPRTASSGEMTAMSFIGRPGVRVFGQPSAGFTTSNDSYPLLDGSMLLLATSTTADRNKNELIPRILPDVLISMEEDIDNTVIAAVKWIESLTQLQ